MTIVDTKEATRLANLGAFRCAEAYQLPDSTWRLRLMPRKGVTTIELNSSRSPEIRVFKTLDATANAARIIGFSKVEVRLDQIDTNAMTEN